jgi:hypothetical protein
LAKVVGLAAAGSLSSEDGNDVDESDDADEGYGTQGG